MARKVQTLLIDDINGEEAAESVTFGLDGITYEIDLTQENAAQLRESVNEWVGHARRVSGTRTRRTSRAKGDSGSLDTRAVRTWARANGHEVSDRGRISSTVLSAYEAAHGL